MLQISIQRPRTKRLGARIFNRYYLLVSRQVLEITIISKLHITLYASVGINLQKKALKQNELSANEHEQGPLPVYRLPLWVIGFVLIVAGSILDFVAFGLAPQSLLAPLAALTLVWNMVR